MKRTKILIIFLALAVLIAACAAETPAQTEVPALVPTEKPAPVVEQAEPPKPTEVPTTVPDPTEVTAIEPAVSETGIIGTTWQWEQFQETSGVNDITVLYSETYTLTLQPDGVAVIQADCNTVQMTYTLEGNSLTFASVGASTLAACPQGSLDTVYLQRLSEVVTYVVEDGKLYLNLVADAGNMIFGQGGLGDLDISPDQITLDTKGLPTSWQAVAVPQTSYDQSQPPGPKGLPAHIEILFGVTDPADRQPNSPIMYIIPVNAYREMWEEAGNTSVSETINMIEGYSFVLPEPAPTSGMPTLPSEEIGGVNDLAVQLGHAAPQGVVNQTSATQTGYRFVGRWAQDANPLTNQNLRYVYQGFTNDARYLVSFWYPVSTDTLPADISGVPAAEMEIFNNTPLAYMDIKAEELNALATSEWQPDLATLDALVTSLQISDMPSAGIQDETWIWTGQQTAGGEIAPVADPSLYQVNYRSDGTINIVADCNLATMAYDLTSSGMAGGMATQAGPMTLAECGPDSAYNAFINNIMAAQEYRVRAGGDTAELIIPDDGGTMFLARLEEFSGGITLPNPEPGLPTATVTAPAGVNVRTGPGSEYPVIGVASFGQTGAVVGVSQDRQYWVVHIPGAPNDQGWVSADYVAIENAENVPVIPAPAPGQPVQLPTTPVPVATTLPVPTSGAPSAIVFEASETEIDAGDTTTFSWSVSNIQEVYMYPVVGDFTDYPVEGQGSREVQPGITTTYELLVFVTDDSTSSERIEIEVDDGLLGEWTLLSMSGPSTGFVVPMPDTELTAVFESNGDLSGSSGCNTYNGGFTAYDEVLFIISPLAATQQACSVGAMEQEQLFLSLLDSADSFQVDDGQLSIFNGSGANILTFAGG